MELRPLFLGHLLITQGAAVGEPTVAVELKVLGARAVVETVQYLPLVKTEPQTLAAVAVAVPETQTTMAETVVQALSSSGMRTHML